MSGCGCRRGTTRCSPRRARRTDDEPPPGIQVHAVDGLDAGEVAIHLPAARALVIADALIGIGGNAARGAPPSWAADFRRYEAAFRRSLRLLHAHGAPVPARGRAALVEALAAPAWGEA